jgi:23S rRNA pseudouridine1911/1915/1917 synthase
MNENNSLKELIIYQDQYIIAINKPVGVLSQSDISDSKSIKEEIESYLQHEVFILNRIDRPVSGIVTFAKSKKSASKFTEVFKKAQKKYIAIVENKPPENSGILENVLQKKGNKAYLINDIESGQLARLKYEYLGQSIKYHYLSIILETGRFHQIRAQLASISCRIMGDVKYGARRGLKDRSIGLHALEILFFHPFLLKELRITADFPAKNIWDDVRKYFTDYQAK